ncbi:MAG TPA: putative zinc-binding metallopeptidase, partial [Rhodopila sp.]|nr:putative zinc-binding metallopeptidase [Rhodopila sp.]
DFLADAPDPGAPKVMTGHDNGLITIALIEADDAERERRRAQMQEPYRSLLGHFRHEVGHYFWDVLVRDGDKLDAFRAMFGDDRQDYGAALQRHYENGPPADWQAQYVSQYASTHPWEDWAETWAHYLHIVDTLEMAAAFGIRVRPRLVKEETLTAEIDLDPYRGDASMQQIIDAWLPLTFAINSLNRAMGQPDLYPFMLSAAVVAKLDFVHRLVHGRAGG